MRKVIALLPMKENSERVPNKNMKNFGGKPLYHAVASQLEKAESVDSFVINTDSEIIKRDALKYFSKVIIIDRPVEIQGDFVPMNEIIACDIEKTGGVHYMQTHSTNPLLTSDTIDKAVDTYFEKLGEYDSVFSVTRLQARLYWQDGKPINHNPEELLRTQDLPPVYEENSNFYIFSRESFVGNRHNRIGLKPFMYETDPLEAVDIDEPSDFVLAEQLYKSKKNE